NGQYSLRYNSTLTADTGYHSWVKYDLVDEDGDGDYDDEDPVYDSEFMCPAGFYSDSGYSYDEDGINVCDVCPEDNYCVEGTIDPEPCPSGQNSNAESTILDNCITCDSNEGWEYNETKGESECVQCPADSKNVDNVCDVCDGEDDPDCVRDASWGDWTACSGCGASTQTRTCTEGQNGGVTTCADDAEGGDTKNCTGTECDVVEAGFSAQIDSTVLGDIISSEDTYTDLEEAQYYCDQNPTCTGVSLDIVNGQYSLRYNSTLTADTGY
ncbi:uncharacterized protein METZ01_LOCUS426640, partial [marine metagenome]